MHNALRDPIINSLNSDGERMQPYEVEVSDGSYKYEQQVTNTLYYYRSKTANPLILIIHFVTLTKET